MFILDAVTKGVLAGAGSAEITVLVTVKAYPTISDQHGEAVCVAGVRTDVDPPRWVRLFPVPFRDLEPALRFEKYDLIRVRVRRRSSDRRPESVVPDATSIRKVGHLDTARRWEARRALVEPLVAPSMCEVRRRQERDGTSLAVIRPAEVSDLVVGSSTTRTARQQAITDQGSLLMPSREALEEMPYTFRYSYRCSDPSCRGHRHSVLDWEIGQAFRKWKAQHSEERALAMIRGKWLAEIAGPDKDTMFFVGNAHLHPNAFMVLGTFWPPAQTQHLLF